MVFVKFMIPVRGLLLLLLEGPQIDYIRLRLYSIQTCLMAEVKDPSWLWHFLYGHLSFDGLKTLKQKNMVTGLHDISAPSKVCEECIVSKQTSSQFLKGKS